MDQKNSSLALAVALTFAAYKSYQFFFSNPNFRYFRAKINEDWTVSITEVPHSELESLAKDYHFYEYSDLSGLASSTESYTNLINDHLDRGSISHELTEVLMGAKVNNFEYKKNLEEAIDMSSIRRSVANLPLELRIKILPILLNSHPEIVTLEIGGIFDWPYKGEIEFFKSLFINGNHLQWITIGGEIVSKKNYESFIRKDDSEKEEKKLFLLKLLNAIELQKQHVRLVNEYRSIFDAQTEFLKVQDIIETLVSPTSPNPHANVLRVFANNNNKFLHARAFRFYKIEFEQRNALDIYDVINSIYIDYSYSFLKKLDDILGNISRRVNIAYSVPEYISGFPDEVWQQKLHNDVDQYFVDNREIFKVAIDKYSTIEEDMRSFVGCTFDSIESFKAEANRIIKLANRYMYLSNKVDKDSAVFNFFNWVYYGPVYIENAMTKLLCRYWHQDKLIYSCKTFICTENKSEVERLAKEVVIILIYIKDNAYELVNNFMMDKHHIDTNRYLRSRALYFVLYSEVENGINPYKARIDSLGSLKKRLYNLSSESLTEDTMENFTEDQIAIAKEIEKNIEEIKSKYPHFRGEDSFPKEDKTEKKEKSEFHSPRNDRYNFFIFGDYGSCATRDDCKSSQAADYSLTTYY